ncbi:MAG: beta-lactamase family protein [Lentisphaeria bacterium]|nr:beta-lactamase family protein [Lentisphaeria bacterium]
MNWDTLAPILTEIITAEIRSGNENCCQLTIFQHGKMVINISCGTDKNSLFPVFSAGKPLLAVLLLQALEQNLIALDTPIAEFWREFGTPDKRDITLEHLLSHRAGLYLLPRSTKAELANWDLMCSRVAAMTPRNTAGSICRYHPLTFAWLLGHTAELIWHKPLPQLLRERIILPLGLEHDLYTGTDESADARMVPVDDTFSPQKPSWLADMISDDALRHSCIPSFNTVASSYGLAKFYASVRGHLLKAETFDLATAKLFRHPEDVPTPGSWENFALGFVLGGPPENRRMFCGHGGAAGSEGFFMPEYDIAVGFVKNQMRVDFTTHPVRDRISAALGVPVRHW